MKLEDHIARTGGAGKDIHIFLDQYFKQYEQDHRVVLHHKAGLTIIAKEFGADAIPIAEQHIRDDWNGALPNDHRDKKFYREAWAADVKLFRAACLKAEELQT